MSVNCKECAACPKPEHNRFRPAPVVAMYYILTEDCNLRCKYCYLKKMPNKMTLDVAMDATRWLIEQCEKVGKTPQTNFFGGEPMLMWDEIIVPLTNWIRKEYKKPFRLGITTNGTLMTEERFKFMKDNDFGCLLSIDGPKHIQDANRPLRGGGSSFDIIAPKIPMFLKGYPNLTFRATFDHDDRNTMIPTHQFAIEQGYNNIFCIPNNLSDWSQEDLAHLRQQIHDLVDYWMDLFRQNKVITFSPLDRAIATLDGLKKLKETGGFRNASRGLGYGKCGTGATGFVSVNYKGDLYACQEMVVDGPEFCVGSIYTGIDDDKRIRLASQFDVMKVRSSAEGRCSECRLNPLCSGGCVANSFLRSGDWHVLPEPSCVYYETVLIEMERMIDVMTKEGNKAFLSFASRQKNASRLV